ncbi:MAG: hypothetical protein JO266_04470 [Acidobacteria bacterium]|nr:hypothetical protein [Deltaproteobacteria bacterium]MBV8891221.1 hypothetical protein [Acidobacteriota bacterium]
MSDKPVRWPNAIARRVAEELLAALEPRCERSAIAGSLRRGKPDVGDIELVYVSRIGQVRKSGELFPVRGYLADELIDRWLVDGMLRKRPNINGSVTWGEYNKLAVHRSGIPVDLFATTTDRWFVTLVMRTGPMESNVALAAAAKRRGMQFHAYGMLERRDGQPIITQSEQEVFERCGVPYHEPERR